MWIKVCGATSLHDACLAAAAGADAIGLIFAANSRRFLDPVQAAEFGRAMAAEFPQVERIGVFTGGTAAEIAARAIDCALNGVQLQSEQTQAEAADLRLLQPQLTIIAAFPWRGAADFAVRLNANRLKPRFHRFLVDSASAQDHGGTGSAFAWQEAAASLADAASAGLPVIAAGGLGPENVTEAVTILRPWGIDAVSALESAPGIKDPARVTAFVHAARTL